MRRILVLVLFCLPAFATNYYVTQSGSATCTTSSSGSPMSVATYNTCTQPTGGDTVLFTGTITSQVTPNSGGTGTGAGNLTLDSSGATVSVPFMTLSRSHVTLNGGTVSAAATSGTILTFSGGPTDITVQGFIYSGSSSTSTVDFAINSSGGMSNITVQGNALTNVGHCINFFQNQLINNITFLNNYCDLTHATGAVNDFDNIQIAAGVNVLIQGNFLRNNSPGASSGHQDVIQSYCPNSCSGAANPSKWTIRYNIIARGESSGTGGNMSWHELEGLVGSTAATTNCSGSTWAIKIYANVYYGGTATWAGGNGVDLNSDEPNQSSSDQICVFNNTFYVRADPINPLRGNTGPGTLYFRNNAMGADSPGCLSSGDCPSITYTAGATWDRNYFFNWNGNCNSTYSGPNGACFNSTQSWFNNTATNDFSTPTGSYLQNKGDSTIGSEYSFGICQGATWPNPTLCARSTGNWDAGAFQHEAPVATYTARTDLIAAEPGAILTSVGGLTGVNSAAADDLGNGLRILRITDANFNPAKQNHAFSIGIGGSSDTNGFSQSYASSGHTHYLLCPQDTGGGTYVSDFDATAFSVARPYASRFPSTGGFTLPDGGCDWAYTSFKAYVTPSTIIESVDMTDWVSGGQSTPPSPVNVFDYLENTPGLPDYGNNKCLAAGFAGQTWNDDAAHSKDDQTYCMAFSWYPDWSASTPFPAGTLIHPTALISGTLVSGTFSAGDAAKQATTNATCTVGAVNNTSTTFSCRYFSASTPPDGTHQWTDTTSGATFNPSGVPTGNAGDWIYYSSGGTSSSGAEPLWGTAQTSGSTVSSDGSITLWTAIQSGQGQGTGNAIACYRVGSGCTTLNTTTGAVGGDWGSSGTITQTDRTLIHNVKVSKDGNWLIIQTTLCGLVNSLATCNAAASPEVWQIGTTNMPPLAQTGQHGSGHWTEGYTHWLNTSSFPNPPGIGGYTIRPFSNGSAYRDIYTAAQMPPLTAPWDGHFGWSNADTNDSVPFVGALDEVSGGVPTYSMGQMNCSGGTTCAWVSGHLFGTGWTGSIYIGGSIFTITGTPTTTSLSITANGPSGNVVFSYAPIAIAWAREIQAISPVTGTTYRFSHTFTSGEDEALFNAAYGIGSVSQDGLFWAGTSDWLGTLGSTSGGTTCTTTSNCRSDVFIFSLTGIAAPSNLSIIELNP